MKIIVSGLVNIETNVSVRGFPIQYYPVDYAFFGVESSVGGVGANISKALKTLGDNVTLLSYTGDDAASKLIFDELCRCDIDCGNVIKELAATAQSAVLYDSSGKRQIYCDLKDIQEKRYSADASVFSNADIAVLCNINFNRELLRTAKAAGKQIATDVHVLSDINDDYNRDFMEYADILFLSDENLPCSPEDFLKQLANRYGCGVIVIGRGSHGVTYCENRQGKGIEIHSMPAANIGDVVNTVGAGDALFSSFLHYYAKGMSVRECLRRAQVFAALKIRCNGASNGFVTEDEVEKFLYAID